VKTNLSSPGTPKNGQTSLSEPTNEIRRARKKLEILRTEGSYELLVDMIDSIVSLPSNSKLTLINKLKQHYEEIVNRAPEAGKQAELFDQGADPGLIQQSGQGV
jgi:hypothetical protein